MKKRTDNMDKNMFIEKSILLTKIKELSKYYNKETIDMLVALVMLDESVFKQIDFGEIFGNLDLFFEIAKYNICNRAIQTIEQINSFDSEKINANFFGKGLIVNYILNEREYFDIFECNFDQQDCLSKRCKQPYIYLFEATTPVSELIKTYTSSIDKLKGIKYDRDDVKIQGNTLDKKPYVVIGGPNSQRYFENKMKIDLLEKRIAQLISCGELQSNVCNKVTDILLQDWNVEISGDSLHNDTVKKLSWINIYKKNL